jgi:hypothetical protein
MGAASIRGGLGPRPPWIEAIALSPSHRELSDGGTSKALVGGQPHAPLLIANAHLDDGVGKRSRGLPCEPEALATRRAAS